MSNTKKEVFTTPSDLYYHLKVEGIGYAMKTYFGRNIVCENKSIENSWREVYDAISKLEELLENSQEEQKS